MENKEEGKITNTRSIWPPILLALFTFFLVFLAITFAYWYYYQNKIYPGVTIAGYDVGGLSKNNAQALVQNKIDKLNNLGLIIEDQSQNKKYEVLYGNLGMFFDKEATLKNAFSFGRSKNIIANFTDIAKALFDGKNINIVTNFDDNLIRLKSKAIFTNTIENPQDATFKIDNENFVIVSEAEGTIINLDQFKEDINNLVNSSNIYSPISLNIITVQPDITITDIQKLKPEILEILDKKISYVGKNYKFNPNKDDLNKWISTKKENGNLQLEFSDNGIKDYISKIAGITDVKRIDKKTDSQGVILNEGQDGLILNQDKAFEDTKKVLAANNANATINLEFQVDPKKETVVQAYKEGGTPGMFNGQYIEVNLSRQTMYLFNGNEEVGAYTVSTGAWDTPTPVGTRTISGKTQMAWSSKYGLYMPYWNDIGGGYGIHELPEWPGGYKEGESHLGIPVSHGCIRLGVGPAEVVYNWAPIGTQVFIHY